MVPAIIPAMSNRDLTTAGFLIRLAGALVIVFASYNPEGYSFYHWARDTLPNVEPLLVLAGVVLLIGWTILLRATLRSLGLFGLMLSGGFLGALIWVMIDFGWISADSNRAVAYITLFILSGVLATGVSWSHIRRAITGQGDVDEVDS